MSDKKKIMILGASILQLPAIIRARQMGLEVIAVDMNVNAIGFKEADICLEISTLDIPHVLEAAKEHKIDGIMTLAADMPMRTVAKVANELGLAGISEQTALNATNKAVMRQCLKQHNVPIPEFYKVNTKEEYLDAIGMFKTMCIVKPADNSGSRGVNLISDLANLDEINKAFEYSMSCSHSGDIVVEEFMEGPEVSVETLSVDGVCHIIQMTDKLTTGAPYFVEMGHNEPSVLPKDITTRIAQVARDAVLAIGIENGPSHTEIKVTTDGPKIVELGARLGGDNITTHLVPLSTGVNMVECCIRIALREKPNMEKKYEKGSAIRYLSTPAGIIRSITGIEKAESIDGVQEASIVHFIGDRAVEIRNSADRVGFVIAQAEAPEKAIALCERAVDLINVVVGE